MSKPQIFCKDKIRSTIHQHRSFFIMRLKLFCLFLLIFGVIVTAAADIAGSLDDKNNKPDDKTTQTTEPSESDADGESGNPFKSNVDDADSDTSTLESMLIDELGLHGSAIKIVKAPELFQEKDAQKVSDMLSTLVSSHAKLIKKFENEIEVIDGSIAALTTEEESPKVQTPEEIEAETLYDAAMKILNRTRSDKTAGFHILQQAASRGHLKAQAEVAWGQLMGNPVEIDVESAKLAFEKLSETGLAEAHMVSLEFTTLRFLFT